MLLQVQKDAVFSTEAGVFGVLEGRGGVEVVHAVKDGEVAGADGGI